MRIALIDNYDSFTFNVVHALGMEGAEVEVFRNDALSADQLIAMGHEAIVISPGPGTPDEAGITLEVIAKAASSENNRKVPLFGICLGHQAIGQAFGGKVMRASPMHGKTSRITHDGKGLFHGINGPLSVARYHSLVVEATSLPDMLVANAHSPEGLVMAMRHRDIPIWGVQFHPESIATEQGSLLCRNFLKMAGEFHATPKAA